ncbi:MAG: hypothetical protein R3Y26_01015 [Rikenellaceae bacterium]
MNSAIKISCINEYLGQKKDFNIVVNSGTNFNVGPNEGWYWQSGEKLYITYSNGTSVYWTYGANQSNPSFTGHLNCTKCSCKGWAGGSNYNKPCPNCGHSYTDHRRPGY